MKKCMKSFDKLLVSLFVMIVILFLGTNIAFSMADKNGGNRPYLVEIRRLCRQPESLEIPDLSGCSYVTAVERYDGSGDFFDTDNCYIIREIDGTIYRFDYLPGTESTHRIRVLFNIAFLIISAMVLAVMLYLRSRLLKPFDKLVSIPYELSRGNLTAPLTENRSRYFGRFVWGINMLRETMEAQKVRELALQKEKQTLLLSISHDIKTPLSAIKLYASALSKGLYKDEDRQHEVSLRINEKADEIEKFVSDLSHAASKDFLQLEVNCGEFYLSEIIRSISAYYLDKLALNRIHFVIGPFTDCIVVCDADRSIKVLQNIIENAIKYGDGKEIRIIFSKEENSMLVTIINSGAALPESELILIFDSFWRGSNSTGKNGSGLGLYICRQLMQKNGW